ncbi:ATP-dependent acyl-CoA ligase [Nocardioides hungaricus]
MLLGHAETKADKIALSIVGEDISYGDLVGRSNSVARALREYGIGKGDVVAILTENCADQVVIEFATARLGAIEVMLNTAYRGDFLAHQLNVSAAKIIIVDSALRQVALDILDRVPSIQHVIVRGATGQLDPWQGVQVVGIDALQGYSTDALSDVPDPLWTDPSTIVFTSGTTGPSKGALMSQNYLVTHAELESSSWYRGPDDVFYSCGPLFHLAAKGVGVLGSIYRGVHCVQDDRFSVSGFWAKIREHDCSATLMLGSMAMLLWTREPDEDEGIDTVVGVPVPASLQDAMAERWKCKFESVYGLSEAAPVTVSGPDVPLRPGSAGKVAEKYYDVRIFDDNDKELEPGQVGEVVIRPRRAQSMFDGYYRDAEATAEKWKNLWFHTGDLGKIDEDGYFFFVDRKKDYLRRRGENISSYEVEAAIARHPAVIEAAVVGVASDLTEDEVKAVVVLRPGSTVTFEELVEHCVANMPYFAVPRYIELTEDLPRTPSGKVLKHQLRNDGTVSSWDREAHGIVLSGRSARAATAASAASER